jgi:hypothetical protein
MPTQPKKETSPDSPRGCSARALIVGTGGALCLALGSVYNDMLIKGQPMARWSLTPAAIFAFFVLVVILNVVLGLIHRRLALQKSELAVAYFLMVLGNTLAAGFSGYLLPVITGSYYYATPENNWGEVVQPYLPIWIGPQDLAVIHDFYEGNPGRNVPWEAWFPALLYWLLFALALFLVMVCMMVILRRQWVDNEKLAYPMAQLPLAMIAGDQRGSLVGPLFRNPLMWLGFALPFTLGSIDALHGYFVAFPSINLSLGSVPLFDRSVGLNLTVYLSIVGFSYLIHQNVALGLWFFHLLSQFERGLLAAMGLHGQEAALGHFSRYLDPVILHRAMGAMIALVLGFLWVGRRHLKDVARKAFLNAPGIDDSDEIISYRFAVFGVLIGLGGMGFWLWQTGVPALQVPLLLFAAFVIFLTAARATAQGGVAAMYTPTVASDFLVSGVGSSMVGATGMAGLALAYPWSTGRATMMVLMVVCANGLKVISEVNVPHRRRLFGGIVAVIALTLVATVSLTFYLGYQYGAINLNWYFQSFAQYPFEFMAKNIENPSAASLDGWIHKGVGAAIMTGLMIVQHRYLWWPFHPLGFPIGCLFGRMWFSVFVAWLLKAIILKYGGSRLYMWLRPVFLGLILGELVVAGFWVIVDYFTGMQNNNLSGVAF